MFSVDLMFVSASVHVVVYDRDGELPKSIFLALGL